MHMRHAIAGLAVAMVAIAVVPAQSPTVVSGRVVSDATGDPIPNVRVGLVPVAPGMPVALTDGDGRFSLAAPRGAFRIAASKSGYARTVVTPESGKPPTSGWSVVRRSRDASWTSSAIRIRSGARW
jgi:hypothetical protein